MSGRGRGRKIIRESIHGISKPAIRRIARRGGVKRLTGTVYEEIRYVLKSFIESVVKDAVTYAEFSRRKTVSELDIILSLRRRGKTLLGFGSIL